MDIIKMTQTKILYFGQIYADYIVDLCKFISSDEFNVTYLTCNTTKYWKPSKTTLENYKEEKILGLSIPIKKGTRGTYNEILSLNLGSYILKNKPDILILDSGTGFSFMYIFLGKLIHSKIIGISTSFSNPLSFWGKISNFILKQNDRFINNYVVPNSVKKQLMQNLGIKKNKISVIGHGIRTERFQINFDKKRKIQTDKKIILFVGRFVKYKGIDYLIKSFEKINEEMDDVMLVLIGNGPEKDNINKLIKNKNLENKVIQINNVTNSEMPDYYSDADIVVVPSIEPEPFGLVYIEAMASGKPVVTFDTGGAEKDLIQNDKNGFIVKEINEKKLATAIYNILKNDEIKKKMGIFSRKFVAENYDIRIISSRWRDLIKETFY